MTKIKRRNKMKNHTLETISNLIDLTNLPDREKTVLKLRIKGQTLKEIGSGYAVFQQQKVSHERIRQIEAKAVRKLWHFLKWIE